MPAIEPPAPPDHEALRRAARRSDAAPAWRAYGDALALWTDDLDGAIDAYRRGLARDAGDAAAAFRLGVCYRLRYDRAAVPEPADFQRALVAWQDAVDRDPNQYIWRRRVQQYGPRLEKPYPFYEWVAEARDAIRARGETPVTLAAEPTGAETAPPLRALQNAGDQAEPDRAGRILRDTGEHVRVETAVAPARVRPGGPVRIHLMFRPSSALLHGGVGSKWNNEAEPLRVWFSPAPGWTVEQRLLEVPNPVAATSTEARAVSVELRAPADVAPGPVTLTAYALYNVCRDAGECLFRRQDVAVTVTVTKP
jgi:hypothetical protein